MYNFQENPLIFKSNLKGTDIFILPPQSSSQLWLSTIKNAKLRFQGTDEIKKYFLPIKVQILNEATKNLAHLT